MTKIVVEQVPMGGDFLECLWDKEKRSVRWQGEEYDSLARLIKSCEGLHQDLLALATVANYLFQGLSFVVIDNPQHFRQSYEARLSWEEQHPEQMAWAQLRDFGAFDLSAMDFPKIEEGRLVFYAFHRQSALPYVVKCSYESLMEEEPLYHYLVPPRKTQECSS